MLLSKEFGQIVRKKRQGCYTQEKLAEKADISTRHLHDIEYGESEPGLRTVVSLACLLDIDLNTLKDFAVHDKEGFYLKEYNAHGKVEETS